jgi:hypothetical protein
MDIRNNLYKELEAIWKISKKSSLELKKMYG